MSSTKAMKWLRFNLFAKPFDAVLTLVFIPTLLWAIYAFLYWVLMLADWRVIQTSAKVLMTGVFPDDQLWRAWVAAGCISGVFGLATAKAMPFRRDRMAMVLGGCFLIASLAFTVSVDAAVKSMLLAAIFVGGWISASQAVLLRSHTGKLSVALLGLMIVVLTPAGPSTWGGLLLSVVLTIFSAALTIPIGILLAFGRQSKVGSIRTLSTGYIETMRAVPLILIVYWIWIALPLLLPSFPIPDVVRGLIGFVVFYSAYAAEYIRSGLQAVPRGQVEAADALGFSDSDVKRMIVLPQAMRVALPGLVGNILDIFNYAPLVFIIGLTDFLRAGQMILANPQNSGQTYEIYVFLFVVYFAIGSIITFMARRLEKHLGKGANR
ncbi:amino acid ABC transporter permease (plasmid) [Agrobacterium leguminum]|uniref:amino acid ABC transporter permease n=1 Tax=Agrobacterium leguminum TaxID=2792015 RepID=UPI00272AE2C9|nr:amino acid ABC transporter permease [Agrobacterium leguminum]WLE01001.1 amino acid ABC transporter permease [Agrobacterium leguminum]